jgi:uncharacterized protein (DUF1778 family)
MTGRSSEKKKPESISAAVTSQIREKIEEAAAWRGVPISHFVREAAVKAADEVIQQERLIQLSREDAERINWLLENPPEPNAAIKKAAKTHQRLFRG